MTAPRHESTQGSLPRNHLLLGDVRTRLAELPDASVDCVITSPPYFALRDYGEPQQLGLEPDIEAWVEDLFTVCAELRRILKPTGGLWLNVGDSYSHHPKEGAPKNSLLMGPSRLALRLVGDGWLLRNHIVWAKTNPMPSNVTDRMSCTHESIYFFTKAERYFFDLNAIREPLGEAERRGQRYGTGRRAARRATANDGSGGSSVRGEERIYPPVGALPRRCERSRDINDGLGRMKAAGVVGHPLGKNPGDVWALATAAYRGEHFATFPAKLVEKPLLSTCPERVCIRCGVPWQRAKQCIDGRWLAVGRLQPDCGCFGSPGTGGRAARGATAGRDKKNTPGNGDGETWQPGVVLDPFMGSGTVALVAEQYQRDWVGIELSPVYAGMAMKRLREWRTGRTAVP